MMVSVAKLRVWITIKKGKLLEKGKVSRRRDPPDCEIGFQLCDGSTPRDILVETEGEDGLCKESSALVTGAGGQEMGWGPAVGQGSSLEGRVAGGLGGEK